MKIIVIGGGLSGLTAARQILKAKPEAEVVVLQAMDRLGGRTLTVDFNGFKFDEGAEFIGKSQKHVIQLAQQSQNQLVDVYHSGTKIIQMNQQTFTYNSDIPNNLNIFGLIHLQWLIWKINRMSKQVSTLDPRQSRQGYVWDSMTAQTWIDNNISNTKIKIMIQVATRSIFGAEPCEISFLFFLWYVNQNKDFDNLININNGLQQMKTKKGTQHFSNFLGQKIKQLKGSIQLNCKIQKIQQKNNKVIITSNKHQYIADYLVVACSPWQTNKIKFQPKLSSQRKLICNRSFMGSYIKVILIYKKAYWKQKGFSGEILTDCADSPLMTAFDDTKINQKGQIQPALIVFVGGHVHKYWKGKDMIKQRMVTKIAEILKQPQMLHPLQVRWKAWQDEETIGGGPTGIFGPGVLTQIQNLRRPEGRIHWGGTQLAATSTGYMDGAIQSGKRVASQIIQRINNKDTLLIQQIQKKSHNYWYTKYFRGIRKWIQWF